MLSVCFVLLVCVCGRGLKTLVMKGKYPIIIWASFYKDASLRFHSHGIVNIQLGVKISKDISGMVIDTTI